MGYRTKHEGTADEILDCRAFGAARRVKLRGALLCLALLTAVAQPAAAQAGPVWVGRFASDSGAAPDPWRVIRLDDDVAPTEFRTLRWEGIDAVEALADKSMALLARPVEIDLTITPILCWRWRVETVVKSADIATKQGDDYAARVYVAFSLPAEAMSLATRARLSLARRVYGEQMPDAAINYVWDNRHPIGTRRPNAFTDRSLMIVQRTGEHDARRWVTERVNVVEDARRAFGSDRARVSLLAIAADTDNTGERVRSGFADLHFVRADESCRFSKDEDGRQIRR